MLGQMDDPSGKDGSESMGGHISPCPAAEVRERPAEVQLLRCLWGCG